MSTHRVHRALAVLGSVAFLQTAVALGASGAVSTWSPRLTDLRSTLGVRTLLLEKLGRDALGIQVAVKSDEAILTGQVQRRQDQELAAETAMSVRGIRKVEDGLTIAPPALQSVPARTERALEDNIMVGKVNLRIIDALGEDALHVRGSVDAGVVTLRGTVRSASEHQKVLEAVDRITGVARVDDQIGER
jgi:osmotically-inducible protein OsmY